MRLHHLPREQVEALEKEFRRARSPNEKLKYQAIRLLNQKYTWGQVSEIVGKSKRTLGEWVSAYNRQGLSGLKVKPQKGNNHKLTKEQKEEIKKLITQKKPEELNIEGRFWNIPLLKRLVKDKFNLTYESPESYRRLFKYCGFSFHKPNKVNKKQKDAMIKRFEVDLKKDSKGIKEKMVWYW